MKSQDIVILLKLASLEELKADQAEWLRWVPIGEDPFSVRNLAASLGISKSEVSASINRSLSSGLALKDREFNRPKPSRRNLLKFIVGGLKYVFPAKPGAIQRGIPTGFDAPMLKGRLMSAGERIHVWPYAKASESGQSVEPLFPSVPQAVLSDLRLHEYLALVDAIRLGNQREAGLAEELLSERLMKR
ncbi:hypothetical protein [Devosia sp.]|uniref:hypothetical protein n=1 Tax=Devosia sp. TaxID=1871048 RepID=UPI001A0497F9|nr:hypothetical protein [Devosia sp.]MBE0577965.1 hypothetical protein [Devosia sp.]MDP2778894.1 hypothetical protein [Devosia sp.]